eukprot:m.85109 g.85109  ORF g.85109 m.85109 type:complete len:101 (+) comp8374_c0_seq1:906-1208(+)
MHDRASQHPQNPSPKTSIPLSKTNHRIRCKQHCHHAAVATGSCFAQGAAAAVVEEAVGVGIGALSKPREARGGVTIASSATELLTAHKTNCTLKQRPRWH